MKNGKWKICCSLGWGDLTCLIAPHRLALARLPPLLSWPSTSLQSGWPRRASCCHKYLRCFLLPRLPVHILPNPMPPGQSLLARASRVPRMRSPVPYFGFPSLDSSSVSINLRKQSITTRQFESYLKVCDLRCAASLRLAVGLREVL